jgi:hypothetical protein
MVDTFQLFLNHRLSCHWVGEGQVNSAGEASKSSFVKVEGPVRGSQD